MEALPAYKNACISPLKASPMHSIIALITPSMVRTWRLRFGPQCGNKGPGRLLSMNSSRYMYGKVWRARSKDSQDAAHFHKYMYGQVWRAGTDLQDVLSANGSYIQGKMCSAPMGATYKAKPPNWCLGHARIIEIQSEGLMLQGKCSGRKNQCETPRNDFAAPDWQRHAWQSAGLTSHPDPTMSTFYNKNIDV